MKGFELAVYGAGLSEIVFTIFILCLLTVFNFIIAYYAFTKIEIKSRIAATLEVY
mgnify:FL=1